MKRRKKLRKIFPFIALIVSLWTAPCQAGHEAISPGELREKATLVYQTDFILDAPIVVWNKLLDHLVLLGAIWNLYHFQPAYEMAAAEGGRVKVFDPSGIKGDMMMIDASATSRTYFCRGSVDHWAIPSFISAEGLFVFRHEAEEEQRIRGKFEVFLKGKNKLADFLLGIAAETLKQYLHNRFFHNLEDMKKIVFDLRNHPGQIRKGLTGDKLKEFNALF